MPLKKSLRRVLNKKSHPWSFLALGIFTVIFLLLSIGADLTYNHLTSPLKRGGSLSLNNPTGPSASAHDLNLAVADTAVFKNTAIVKTQTLPKENKSNKFVISFNVPLDNLKEYALMTVPTTPRPAKGYPTIILCHGYVNPKNYSTAAAYLPDMEFYTQHGFAVIKPDYRGQGLSKDAGLPSGAYYSMDYNTDVMSLIAAVKQTSYLDKNNINMWGHSMGAYIALRASVLSPDIKHTILLSGPVGTPQDRFNYKAPSDSNNLEAAKVRSSELLQNGTPVNNPGYWNKTSPLNYLTRTKTYFQIHVGTNDQVVPPKQSADMDQALTANNIPHAYYSYPGGAHGLLPQRQVIWSRSLQLLEQKT